MTYPHHGQGPSPIQARDSDIDKNSISEAQVARPVFLTGGTGYIGGRLVPHLLARGYSVRCLVRSPAKLASRDWHADPRVEILRGDLFEMDSKALALAMAGCGAAYYLVHGMISAGIEYARLDKEMAERFARAAASADLGRIIYLGGLGELGDDLSAHLVSRREVGAVLARGSVPVTELRAAMIIGSGSASFETLRFLVERLPAMITPRWVSTEAQPIAVRNVLHYLVECLDHPDTVGRTLDIGGSEIMTYREILQVMAASLGLRRRFILPVPVLTPKLSSLWIHLVTPISHRIARPLAEGLRNRVVCRDDAAARLMPQRLLGIRESIDAALGNFKTHEVRTAWSDAGPIPGDPDWSGGKVFEDRRIAQVRAPRDVVFATVSGLGGDRGYYAANWLWHMRGWMDRLVGGPGLRRGRRDPDHLAFGDALDFWRVTGVESQERLQLRAEMKLPGEAQLAFDIEPGSANSEDVCTLTQTARFKPRGLLGLGYWYAVLPFHGLVFAGMLKGIRRAAERAAREKESRREE